MDTEKILELMQKNHNEMQEANKQLREEMKAEVKETHRQIMILLETAFFELRLLREKMESTEKDVKELKVGFRELSAKVDSLEARVERLEDEVKDVKAEVKDVKGRIIIMEEDFGRSIRALHDSAEITKGYALEIRAKFNEFTDTQQTHEFSLKHLSAQLIGSKAS